MSAPVREIDTGTEVVRAWVLDGVGTLQLNRPERRNALHPDMLRVLPELVARLEDDDEVGCIVLSGAGTAFCAGGDVQDGARRGDEPAPPVDEAAASLVADAQIIRSLRASPLVSIAALNGPAVGAGLSLALACDLRLMGASATLLPGWATLGFSSDFGGSQHLGRLLGSSRALEWFTSNRRLSAESALAWGLVNRVVPDDELVDEVQAWASSLAAGPRSAWALFKENLRDVERLSFDDALGAEATRMVLSGRTEDHRQAVRAWLRSARERRGS